MENKNLGKTLLKLEKKNTIITSYVMYKLSIIGFNYNLMVYFTGYNNLVKPLLRL